MSEKEIRERVFKTSPNRWWAGQASFNFRPEGRQLAKYLDITLEWGKVITVELKSGKIQEPPKASSNR